MIVNTRELLEMPRATWFREIDDYETPVYGIVGHREQDLVVVPLCQFGNGHSHFGLINYVYGFKDLYDLYGDEYDDVEWYVLEQSDKNEIARTLGFFRNEGTEDIPSDEVIEIIGVKHN